MTRPIDARAAFALEDETGFLARWIALGEGPPGRELPGPKPAPHREYVPLEKSPLALRYGWTP
jgi:hypothetical protein